jgi:GNAT superfamily N-acetyltransferase
LSPSRIVELSTEGEFRRAWSIMRELRSNLTEERYMHLLEDMRANGYRLFAVHAGGSYVALAGMGLATNLYYGRYLWVYDLITTEGERSRGHGRLLLTHLEQIARDEGCDTIALASGLQRADAHRFYENHMRYERASYAFVKKLR